MKYTLPTLTILFLLGSPVFSEEAEKVAPAPTADSTKTSRLRMFGQNGASVVLFKDSACVKSFWSSDGEKVSGGLGSAFSSFAGTSTNDSLGIPESETTLSLSKKDGFISKAYYREYLIPAEKPSSMRMGFRTMPSFYVQGGIRHEAGGASCSGAISFTPQAGADYEVGFDLVDRVCRLSMNQVLIKDGKTELVPVSIMSAPDC